MTTGRLNKTREERRGGDALDLEALVQGEVGARQVVFYAGFRKLSLLLVVSLVRDAFEAELDLLPEEKSRW